MTHILGRRWSQLRGIMQGNTFPVPCTPKLAFCSLPKFETFLSPEDDPTKHTFNDVGLFYKIDNKLALDNLFKGSYLHETYVEECKTFNGTYIMIRKPAMEIINCLKHTNYEHPVNKYVLFGKRGYGVSMSICHVMHYAHVCDWLIVHVPTIIPWLISKTERVSSVSKEGLIDLPARGSVWLNNFKIQNLEVIKKFDLKLQNDYVWNIQEEHKKGESLLNLLDHGINRAKYSCDVIIGLLEELKLFSKSGIVKMLVALDNYSLMFTPGKKSTRRRHRNLAPKELSFLESFKNLAKADWHNGAVVLSCFSERIILDDKNHLPLNQLSLEGFEFLDPFVPIEVPALTDREMTNVLDFYRSNKWLSTAEGDRELKALSGGNMGRLRLLCGPL